MTLEAWFAQDPLSDSDEIGRVSRVQEPIMILQLCHFVTIPTNFQVLKYNSHSEQFGQSFPQDNLLKLKSICNRLFVAT